MKSAYLKFYLLLMNSLFNLKDKLALITKSGKGIGKNITCKCEVYFLII